MNRLTRFSGAAFGMVMLAGLAYYQGGHQRVPGEEDVLVGTALHEPQVTETEKSPAAEPAANEPCDPSENPEDPDLERCDRLSQK